MDEFDEDEIEVELDTETSTEEIPYISNDIEWVQTTQTKLKEIFGEGSVFVFSPVHYKDVGLPTFESMERILKPGTGKGSIQRYILRFRQNDTEDRFFLVKLVAPLSSGRNEMIIGRALSELHSGICIGVLFGFPGVHHGLEVHYNVVPWIVGAIPLDSYLNNKMPEKFNLSTKQRLRMIQPILSERLRLWNLVKLMQHDIKLDQIMVVENTRLILVDFGHSSLEGIVNGESFLVGPHGGHRSGSKSLQLEMEEVLNVLHKCIS